MHTYALSDSLNQQFPISFKKILLKCGTSASRIKMQTSFHSLQKEL